jgi:uncharacterized membrane protein
MKKLERCLHKMPYEEREDAINYYSEYFAEAGPAREQEIILRLGPPQRVATEIRADAALRELNFKTKLSEKSKEIKKAEKSAGDANPKLRESISASWLGTVGMLGMPIARPFAVLAFVLGIIGLVLSVIVVVAIYIAAGILAISGAVFFGVSFAVIAQDVSVAILLAGSGLICMGFGIVFFVLNLLLGRAIFKGIANLSGRIRHKRVKIRKDAFHHSYTYGNPYSSEER